MLSVIKTAIITIIISFISGVLLDHYKNVAPRIVCHVGKCIPVRLRNRRIRTYILTVRNISKQTIHDLNLNLQAPCESFRIDDAKITKGLKFDISNEGNIYDVSIPFLSKNDEFKVKVFLEGSRDKVRPIIALRSPENFKRIDSGEDEGLLNSVKRIPEDISEFFSKRKNNSKSNNAEESFFRNKKAIIAIASAIVLIFAGVLTTNYLKSSKEEASSSKSVSNQSKPQSTGESNTKQNASTESNDKSKPSDKNENSNKSESSSGNTENNKAGSSNKSVNNNTKTSANTGSGSENTKSSGDNIEKNSEINPESSANEKGKDDNKKALSENSEKKAVDEKAASNDTNKSISQGSEAKTNTGANNTP